MRTSSSSSVSGRKSASTACTELFLGALSRREGKSSVATSRFALTIGCHLVTSWSKG